MLRSNLCDYSDAYILAKGTITITGNAGPEPNPDAPRTAAQLLSAQQDKQMKEIKVGHLKIVHHLLNA